MFGLNRVSSPINTSTSPYSAFAFDLVPCDTTAGNVTVNLPTAPSDKVTVGVKMVTQGGTNTVTINATGGDVFNTTSGGTSLTLSLVNQGCMLQYSTNLAGWTVLSDDLALSSLDSRYLHDANNLSDVADAGSSRANIHVPALTPAVAAATGNISITSAPAAIDNVTPSTGDIVLLPLQTTTSQNGVWVYNGSGSALTRPTEFSSGGTVKGRTCQVSGGTTYANTIWSLDVGPGATVTIDTTAQSWSLLTPLAKATVPTPSTMAFLAESQLATTTSPLNTRRTTISFGSGASGTASGYQDINHRAGFTLPVTPTRCRLRIRNADVLAQTTKSQSVVVTGIYWGTPNAVAALETVWQGDFTAAPTLVDSGTTQDLATEYETAWFTPPTSAVAGAYQGLSIGYTVATDSKVNIDSTPGWTFHGATGAGASSAAGNAAVPSGGGITASTNVTPFDVRMEYEFIGDNAIGLVFGDSVGAGCLSSVGTLVAHGHMGPDDTWPMIFGLRKGACIINASFSGGQTAFFKNTFQMPITRFDLGPTLNSGVSCTPDFAIIALGVNDSFNCLLSLYQTRLLDIVGNLQAAGINRIFVCTATTAQPNNFGNLPGCQAGLLKTTLTAGALSSVSIVGPVSSTTAQAAPGGGNPGTPTNWYNASDVFTVASCTTTNASPTVTVPSGGFPSVITGMMVTGTGINNGTQVSSISGNTLTLTQNATAGGTVTLTFNGYGIFFDHPASGVFEGPFPLSAASGTTTLTLTAAGTTANQHIAGGPIFTLTEGTRQQINNWLRQGVPGVSACFDFAEVAQAGGKPGVAATGDPSVPFSQPNWEYYGQTQETHPLHPGLYHRMASMVDIGLAGI